MRSATKVVLALVIVIVLALLMRSWVWQTPADATGAAGRQPTEVEQGQLAGMGDPGLKRPLTRDDFIRWYHAPGEDGGDHDQHDAAAAAVADPQAAVADPQAAAADPQAAAAEPQAAAADPNALPGVDSPAPLPEEEPAVADRFVDGEEAITVEGLRRQWLVERSDFKYQLLRVSEMVTPDGAVVVRNTVVADHFLVSLAPGVDRSVFSRNGLRIRRTIAQGRVLLVAFDCPDLRAIRTARRAIDGLPGVRAVDEDVIVTVSGDTLPDDPWIGNLWGLHNTGQTDPNGQAGIADADIDAPEVWVKTTGSRSVIVGVIDTGVDIEHPDLNANIWTNPREIPDNGYDDDGNGYIDDVHGWNVNLDSNQALDDGVGRQRDRGGWCVLAGEQSAAEVPRPQGDRRCVRCRRGYLSRDVDRRRPDVKLLGCDRRVDRLAQSDRGRRRPRYPLRGRGRQRGQVRRALSRALRDDSLAQGSWSSKQNGKYTYYYRWRASDPTAPLQCYEVTR